MPINSGPSMGMMVPPQFRNRGISPDGPFNLPRQPGGGMVSSHGPGSGAPNTAPRQPRMLSSSGGNTPGNMPPGYGGSGGGFSSLMRGGVGGVVDPSFRDKISQMSSSFGGRTPDPNAVRMLNAGYGRHQGGLPNFDELRNNRLQEMQIMNGMGGFGGYGPQTGFNPMMGYGGGMMGGQGGGMGFDSMPSPQMMMRQFNMPWNMSMGGMNPGYNTGIAGGGFRY